MLRRILASILRLAGRTYLVDPKVSEAMIAGELYRRGIELCRGLLRARRLIFLGKRVSVRGRALISFGKLSAIGASSYIDGRSVEGMTFAPGSKVGRYATISGTSHLGRLGRGFSLGARSGIGDFAHIGCSGGVYIAEDVIIGPFCTMHSQEHLFDDLGVPIRSQGTREAAVVIESNVWVGARVTVLSGVTIGSGSIIAAGSVVRASCPPNSIIGGVPARILRSRTSPDPVLDPD